MYNNLEKEDNNYVNVDKGLREYLKEAFLLIDVIILLGNVNNNTPKVILSMKFTKIYKQEIKCSVSDRLHISKCI